MEIDAAPMENSIAVLQKTKKKKKKKNHHHMTQQSHSWAYIQRK